MATPFQNVSKARVEGNPSLERDMASRAIINRNQSDYQRRLAQKRVTAQKDKAIEDLQSEVSQLKELVRTLISSSKKDSS